ncbi:pyridoxamine kinase [Loigolactobacillus backii]|uniref:pyridoxal kinase n=1 Tax=Loigolactobacillus backii TaxID=375175 RepID=A0A192GZ37_9LACO|nr:pyridoxamine kinase [Loigolactobacillus backii]ANK58981.1 pyridoxal kinase [Loigolactobacillus backii]ANK61350.1 pyridoxal kinase [Loigolactobacillus backii]ANK63969.1 pyridoxal kinase [Loigolactobacillus backii]ANK66418.1 pyridoxal kinase [Loigolactobacillus backii]ANK69450.1 pyridoxal kinase [Loigolactobacillus backii]
MVEQQKILISEDLSCVGQVSLCASLPLFAALDFNPCLLPTALLSTHTGGFGTPSYLDLAAEMPRIIEHWQSLDLKFSALYFGYLGAKPLRVILRHLTDLKTEQAKVLVDPVMADQGQLYSGFTLEYVEQMRHLAKRADLLTPNLTEAQLLLGENMSTVPCTLATAKALAQKLTEVFSIPAVVITGVPLIDGTIGIIGAELKDSLTWSYQQKRLTGHYFGTGDIFASVLFGGVLRGLALRTATEVALKFVTEAIKRTQVAGSDVRYGVNYAAGITELIETVQKRQEE